MSGPDGLPQPRTTDRPVLIMAGGTGGHVFPALAVAERLRQAGVPVVWMGTRQGLEAKLVPAAGIAIEWIGVAGLRGKGLRRLLTLPFMLGRALLQARTILRRLRPPVVLGMGGFASGPGGLAARLLGIPLVVHEQNAVAGLTNTWLARLANQVLEAFPGTFPPARHAMSVGNPVREAIAALPPPIRAFWDLHGRLPNHAQRRMIEDAQITDLRLWRRCLSTWAGRGYNPMRIDGPLEWYAAPDLMDARREGRSAAPPPAPKGPIVLDVSPEIAALLAGKPLGAV